MGQTIILAVTNDLTGDQRIHKVAMSLLKAGMEPVLVGRKMPRSLPLNRPYRCVRLRLLFRKGPMFYVCFNIRLFFYLLGCRADRFLANDLDTLMAVWYAGRLRRKPVIYDSHEYFTEVPELVHRPRVRRIWERMEEHVFPRLKTVYTVNESIARIYQEKYRIPVGIVKNLPLQNRIEPQPGTFPENFAGCPVILYQGAVNIGRGLEEMIRAMEHLVDMRLIIIGDGDIRKGLAQLVQDLGVGDRVCLPGRVPFENLAWYTRHATMGISMEQDIGLNYRYALPNKLFDYMQAGLPVLASDLPEIRRVVEDAQFGIIIRQFDPVYLSETIRSMIKDQEKMKQWHQNALKAFPRYTWESQESTLLSLISGI